MVGDVLAESYPNRFPLYLFEYVVLTATYTYDAYV